MQFLNISFQAVHLSNIWNDNYECQDRLWHCSKSEALQTAKLCNVLKISEIFNDERFNTNSSRSKNIDELKVIIENKLSSKITTDWVSQMEKERIPCGPIYNIKEAVENPQVQSRNMIVKAYHKVIGDFKLAGNPIKMSSYKDETTRGDIPDLDEHKEKILKEFS